MSTRKASNARHRGLPVSSVTVFLAVMAGVSAAFPADDAQPGAQSAPSKQMREQMANLHEQMAACLRSDKPVSACHSQMMKSCQSMMDGQGCSMMGMGKGMHGQMMRQKDPSADTNPK